MMLQNALSSTILPPLKKILFVPIMASFLKDRTMGLVISGVSALQLGLVLLGLPGLPCPAQTLGMPCPGCGLSRAIVALLRGDWQAALTFHAFAPFLLLALILITCSVLLPFPQRRWLINWVEVVERHTGITAILLFGLVFYWLARLLILRAAFINLIVG